MSVKIVSLSQLAQTLDSVVLGAYATQIRGASTAALVAAVAAKTIQMDVIPGSYKQTPLTGTSYVIPNDCNTLYVVPAGTIAAYTLTMPAAPSDGQEVTVSFDQIVTALTMAASGSDTLKGALTAATAKGFAKWKYEKADTTWYRVG